MTLNFTVKYKNECLRSILSLSSRYNEVNSFFKPSEHPQEVTQKSWAQAYWKEGRTVDKIEQFSINKTRKDYDLYKIIFLRKSIADIF